jgi:hypothetical protein
VTVTDVHSDTVDFTDDFFAQAGIIRRVCVSEHSFDRGDQSELLQNSGAADIPRVKDELNARQCLVYPGPKEPVRIRD